MPKKIQQKTPDDYPVCLHGDCPKADQCLHRLAYTSLVKEMKYLRLVNPTMCRTEGNCPFYSSDTPVAYARGFKNFQRKMYPDQYRKFMAICMSRFSGNAYYVRRRGDFLLPPDEQAFILNALKRAGVDREMKFDSYEEHLNWYD